MPMCWTPCAALALWRATASCPETAPAELARYAEAQRREVEKKERQALAVWNEALPIHGSPAETYLRGRSITCALPETLRFHQECWHGATARRLPAMVARVDGAARFAVHRTYLRPDGSGKAEVNPAKAMLGATQGAGPLVVAEGMETVLSLACGLLRAPATIWAALSAPGITALRLPDIPGRLTRRPMATRRARPLVIIWPNAPPPWAGPSALCPRPMGATGTTFSP